MRSFTPALLIVTFVAGHALGQPGPVDLSQERVAALCRQLKHENPLVRQRAAMEASLVFEQLRPLVAALGATVADESAGSELATLVSADALELLGDMPAKSVRESVAAADPAKGVPSGALELRRYLPDVATAIAGSSREADLTPYGRSQIEALNRQLKCIGKSAKPSPLVSLVAQGDRSTTWAAVRANLPADDYADILPVLVATLESDDAEFDFRCLSALLVGKAGAKARPFQVRLETQLASTANDRFGLRAVLAVSLLMIAEEPQKEVERCCRVWSHENFLNHTMFGLMLIVGQRLLDQRIVPVLEKALASSDSDVRLGAIRLAGACGPRARTMTEAVARAVESEDKDIRLAAIMALPMIASERDTVRVFSRFVNDGRFSLFRDEMQMWLTAFGAEASIQTVPPDR